ncbi:hypothetical protein FJ365_04395 [Candidatus Dependentiae bacterium]|nr:hypothetical protein [Candidatus Dependentiae bacterium]
MLTVLFQCILLCFMATGIDASRTSSSTAGRSVSSASNTRSSVTGKLKSIFSFPKKNTAVVQGPKSLQEGGGLQSTYNPAFGLKGKAKQAGPSRRLIGGRADDKLDENGNPRKTDNEGPMAIYQTFAEHPWLLSLGMKANPLGAVVKI